MEQNLNNGTKHLIECHCVLPQFRGKEPIIYHKFMVFSVINDDKVDEKFSQCNNCGVIHRVFDICKSEIMQGNDESSCLRTINDISLSLPSNLSQYLITQNVDIATMEQIEFMIENKIEGSVTLRREIQGSKINLKLMTLSANGTFKVKNEVIDNTMSM